MQIPKSTDVQVSPLYKIASNSQPCLSVDPASAYQSIMAWLNPGMRSLWIWRANYISFQSVGSFHYTDSAQMLFILIALFSHLMLLIIAFLL